MNYFESIEDYLTGKLSGKDLQRFELELRNNPDLKDEVSFQKDIIDNIKSIRKAELKARLAAIPVTPTPFWTFSKYFYTAVGVTAIVATGVLGYLSNKNNGTETSLNEKNITNIKLENNTNSISNNEDVATSNLSSEVVVLKDKVGKNSPNRTISEKKSSNKDITSVVKNDVSNKKSLQNHSFKMPNAISLNDNVDNHFNTNLNVDNNSAFGDNTISKQRIINPEFNNSKKYNFHYEYDGDKIVLWTTDQNSESYLFIDIVSSKKLFMEYNNEFYEITGTNQPTSLKDVLVKDVIKKGQLKQMKSQILSK